MRRRERERGREISWNIQTHTSRKVERTSKFRTLHKKQAKKVTKSMKRMILAQEDKAYEQNNQLQFPLLESIL